MSVVYRDREQSRFDDSKTSVSARSGGTKVTRYIVKEDDSRTDYGRSSRAEPTRQSRYDDNRSSFAASRFDERDDSRFDETRTIRISRSEEEPRREFREPSKYTRETITIRRNEDDERDEYWRRGSGEDVQDRELVISRNAERDVTRDGRTSVALSRIDDRETKVVDDRRYSDYEVVNSPRPIDDREISRYVRTSEHYYPQQNQPQTIIIRQEPIIIRERERDRDRERSRSRPREEEFQIVKRSEIDDERSVSRRSERTEPRDEEYFYERRVRERIPEEDRRSRLRREVSPGDSISQAGRGRRRGSESDDSMVYVRKEKITDYGSRDSSAHRGRDMAAGALAGVGAAELIRNHHAKEGKETSSGIGRVAKDAGAGILGAVAAEGIRRYRSKSRRRSRSSSGGRRSVRRRSRSRSRSSSNNRFGNLGGIGGLGLAAAAVGVGALIASRNKKNASPERVGRSRSRSRRRSSSRGRSVSSARLDELENDPNANDARNPKHRNSRTAAAGAVGAAAAALLEHHRSKSRGRDQSGSPNRFKQAVPIVATGLGTAALAHLYEKNKAKNEAEEIMHDEDRRSRSRGARSRSRGRADSSIYQDGPRQVAYSDPNLVQYGNEPLYGNNYGEGYYGTARSAEPDYYNNNNRAMVPAPAPPPAASSFDATSRRPRSNSRTRSVSSSRSRSRGAAAAAAAAGAGVAASAYEQNRKDKKDRSRRRQSSRGSSRRQTFDSRASIDPYNGRDPYEDANWHATHSASYAQGMNDPYGSQAGFYPPPPGPMPQQAYAPQQSYTPQPAYAPTPPPQGSYHPQDFPPPPPNMPQAQQQQFNPYAPNQNPYAPRPRGTDDNVSAGNPSSAPNDQYRSTPDGLNRERIISPPMVGPEVTLQRPSVSTPVQPRNKFPGNASNPFAQQASPDAGERRGIDSGEASPGHRGTPQPPEESQPGRTFSRAAQRYTPQSQPTPQPREVSRSNDTTPRPFDREVPIMTDQPAPLANEANSGGQSRNVPANNEQPNTAAAMSHAEAEARSRNLPAPTAIPPHMQSADSRSTARAPASPVSSTDAQSTLRTSPEPMETSQSAPPQDRYKTDQRGPSRSFATPFMESPDMRPPSDDSLPDRSSGRSPGFITREDNAPSMPNLFIPTQSPDQIDLKSKQAEDRPARPRTPSPDEDSAPRERPPSPTPVNSRKRSVSFNPRLDFNEAPKNRSHPVSDSEDDDPEVARRKRRERERERDRGRDRDHHERNRDKHRRGYDGGDDFSDDTPFEDHRRRSRDNDRDRRSSRRERIDTQSLDRDQDRDGDHDRHDRPKRSNTMGGSSSSGSHHHHRRDRDRSPGSDETVDLPDRFDDKGRRKNDKTSDQDLIAQSLDQILGGLFGGKGKK